MEMCEVATSWTGKHHLTPSDPHHRLPVPPTPLCFLCPSHHHASGAHQYHSASVAHLHHHTSSISVYHKVTGPWGSPVSPRVRTRGLGRGGEGP